MHWKGIELINFLDTNDFDSLELTSMFLLKLQSGQINLNFFLIWNHIWTALIFFEQISTFIIDFIRRNKWWLTEGKIELTIAHFEHSDTIKKCRHNNFWLLILYFYFDVHFIWWWWQINCQIIWCNFLKVKFSSTFSKVREEKNIWKTMLTVNSRYYFSMLKRYTWKKNHWRKTCATASFSINNTAIRTLKVSDKLFKELEEKKVE